jgi:hypothetical protein
MSRLGRRPHAPSLPSDIRMTLKLMVDDVRES